VIVWSSLLGGCARPIVGRHGQTGLEALYHGRTLTADLPLSVPVPSVAAAAEQHLRATGWTITASDVTNQRARVVARPPDDRLAGRMEMVATREARTVHLMLEVEPFGSEAVSRSVLDGMVRRLGL
jgi:hypothetical protein